MKSSLEEKLDRLDKGVDALIAERDRLREQNREMLEAIEAYFDSDEPAPGHVWRSEAKRQEARQKMRDAIRHAKEVKRG